MRYPASPNLLDWVSSSLRWLILFGLTISLANSGALSLEVEVTLLVAAAWSLGLTVLVAFDRRFAGQRYAIVGGDALFAGLLFLFRWLDGGLGWPAAGGFGCYILLYAGGGSHQPGIRAHPGGNLAAG